MPAPVSATYDAAAKVAAHTAFRDLLDAGSGPAKIRLRSEADVLLAEAVLTDPCGTVNGTTGQLTFSIATQEEDAPASGDVAYGEFVDSDNNVRLAMPAKTGATYDAGWIVMNTLSVVEGNPVEIVGARVG